MQVTLTPHAEELLRTALAHDPGQSAESILEQAFAEHLAQAPVPPDPVWEQLKRVPGVKLPDHWPLQFEKLEPIHVAGEPVSEQLIRERR